MAYYTERNGMRKPIEKTYQISVPVYGMLFDCCERYFNHLAWKYRDECPDCGECCGIDFEKFSDAMVYEIPTLFRRSGMISKPETLWNAFTQEKTTEEYDQYALLDLIEYIAQKGKDIKRKQYHSFYRHYDMSFGDNNLFAVEFQKEINEIFEKTGLLYLLNDDYQVERIEEYSAVSKSVIDAVQAAKEPGIRELLKEALNKHKSPYPTDQQYAVEKLWDAFERVKTAYTEVDKKKSAQKLLTTMADGNTALETCLTEDFRQLTQIGNNFKIRHHETNQIQLNDSKYYDYFFNRCLSTIALAIQFL